MDKAMWPRLGAASGMLFVALLMSGESIPVGDGWLAFVGFLMFIPFLGYLFSVLRRAEGGDGWLSTTAFGAGLIALAVHLASSAPYVAAQDVEKGSQLASALIAINGLAFVTFLGILGLMVGAASAVVIKTRVLPLWLGWAGIVTAIALLVNSAFSDAEFVPAFLLFLPWTVLTSAILTWRAGAPRPVETALTPSEPQSVG